MTRSQYAGLAADIKEARQALDRMEYALRCGEHPNRIADYVREVERWMSFAHGFCSQAAQRLVSGGSNG